MQPVIHVQWSLHSKIQRATASPLLFVDLINTIVRKTLTASTQFTIILVKPASTGKNKTSFTHQIIFSTQSLTVLVGASKRSSEKQPGIGTSMLHFHNLHCKVSHKDNIKEDTPHLCFLEPISSLLVKTWTLVEIKKNSKWGILANCSTALQTPIASILLTGLLAIEKTEERQEGQGMARSDGSRDTEPEPFLFTRAAKQHWQQIPNWVGSVWRAEVLFHLETKSLKVWSSAQLLVGFIPARFHRQLQLPQAAHTPRSPAGPEKQNLGRKLGQRWVLPQYRTTP